MLPAVMSAISVCMSVISVVCARDLLNPALSFTRLSCGIYQFNNCCKGVVLKI